MREEAEERRMRNDNDMMDEGVKAKIPQPSTGGNKEFLLMDQSNIDYEQMKNQYPLRGNRGDEINSSPDPKGGISANDISAFGDESMISPPGVNPMQGLFNGLRNGNQGMFDDMPDFEDAGGI